MPSLVRDSRGRSPFWICCYESADGRRLKKTTKQSERTKAMEVCLGIDRAERLAGAGNLTEQTAKKILGEILERTGQELRSYRVEAWFEKWLADTADTAGESTMERYKQVRREFVDSLGARARLPLASITDDDVRTYRKELQTAGLAAKSCNNAVKCLSASFNRAVRLHIIASNPCTAIDPLPEETATRKTFTVPQVRKLIKAAEGDWKLAILFGYHTGGRVRFREVRRL